MSICVSEALASGGLRTGSVDRADRICRKARLAPGSYQVDISEDKNTKRVSVEIRYEAEFSIFFVKRHEKVVLRNDFYVLDL